MSSKSFSIYYAIERNTDKRVAIAMGSRGQKETLRSQMKEDAKKADFCKKYKTSVIYTDYGIVATRSIKMPVEEKKEDVPKKKPTKKVSEK